MTGFPSKLVPIGFEFPLRGIMKIHHPLPPYLPLSIFLLLIHPITLVWALGWPNIQGLYLTLWEEGAKGQEGKSSWKRIKYK
jgi:hypothetical protein